MSSSSNSSVRTRWRSFTKFCMETFVSRGYPKTKIFNFLQLLTKKQGKRPSLRERHYDVIYSDKALSNIYKKELIVTRESTWSLVICLLLFRGVTVATLRALAKILTYIYLYWLNKDVAYWVNNGILHKFLRIYLGTALYWAITQDSWPLKVGLIGCSETSVRNCLSMLRNSPDERSSYLLRWGSLKSPFMFLVISSELDEFSRNCFQNTLLPSASR